VVHREKRNQSLSGLQKGKKPKLQCFTRRRETGLVQKEKPEFQRLARRRNLSFSGSKRVEICEFEWFTWRKELEFQWLARRRYLSLFQWITRGRQTCVTVVH
jgi:hypothetical protein